MRLRKDSIQEHNQTLLAEHQRGFDFIAAGTEDAEAVIERLMAFQIAIPSWALGSGGTRFGRFPIGGEPRNLEEKIEDIGLLHALNRSSGAISLHIPWDIPENPALIKMLAAQYGIRFDAMNSNTFQDQRDQQHSYKFGSLQHLDRSVRQQAIAHNLEVIRHGVELGSTSLTVWLADGSCFPGQLNFREAFQRTLESLAAIYDALPADWKMFVEYKAFEPNFYSMTVGDWGLAWMIDASHNLKDPLEDLLQSVEAILIAYAQALLVDRMKLREAREQNDVVAAQQTLQDAFRTDVRPLVAEARLRSGGALDTLAVYRAVQIRTRLITTRGSKTFATGL
jgi:L-rhamnose isomerase